MSQTKVTISVDDKTAAGIASVKSHIDELGTAAQVWSGVLKGAAAGLAGALSANSLKDWIKGSIDAADSMKDMSQRIGISVRDLGTWSLAAAQSGTSMTAIGMGVKSLSGFMARHSEELRNAGITATDANGAMVQLADLFAALPDGVQKTALATKLFGRTGGELIPILNGGSAELEKLKNKAADYAAELEKLVPRADEFNDLLAEIELQSKATGLAFADKLIEPMTDVVELFRDARSGADGFTSAMTRLQTLTNSGPTSIFGALAALSERGGFAHRAAALNGLGGDDQKRTARGLIAGGAGDIAAKLNEEEKLGERNLAGMRAKGLMGSETRTMSSDPFDTLLKGIDERTAVLAAEAESTDRLSESQKFALKVMIDLQGGYIKTIDETTKALRPLNDAERIILATRLETGLAFDQNNQATEALRKTTIEHAKAMEQASAAQRRVLEALEDKASAAEFELATYGMTKSEIEATTIARLEERRELIAGLDLHAAEIDALDREIAARKRLRDAMAGVDAKAATKKAIDDQGKEWKRFTDDVDRALTDALMRGFENGKDGGKAFVDSIKNTLKTAAFKIVVQAAVNPVMGQMGSALGMTGGGSGGGIGDLFSVGSSASNALGSSAYSAFALSETGASMGLSTAYIDALGIGEAVGGTALSALGTALPWIGGAIAVGSMLGLFDGGGEDPHNNAQVNGFELGLNKAGVFAVQNSDATGAPSSMVAGPTSGAGWWADSVNLSAAQIAAINQQVAATFAQGDALARMLGIDPSVIDAASVNSQYNGTPGNGAIGGYFASLDQAFTALGDSIAVKVIPNLSEFQQTGESLAATASRISQEFVLTNRMATLMGYDSATAFGGNNLNGRDDLVRSLGGISGATSVFDSYYKNFHSETERMADTRGSIAATLRAIGISDVPATRDQFRSLVEGQDLATEAGRSMYATLLSVAEAFTGITESAEEAAKALAAAMGPDRFRTRADYIFAQKTGIIPAYADGGDHGGGWAMVGERGRELAYMPPAHVYSNRDSKALLDLSEVTQAINSLRDDLRADLRAANAAMVRASNKTAKILDQWDGDGMPAVRVL